MLNRPVMRLSDAGGLPTILVMPQRRREPAISPACPIPSCARSGKLRTARSEALARSLDISTDTVRFHIRNVYRKLHAHSQSEAVAKALRKGII